MIKYVITNPDKDLILKEGDTVFVLAQNDPKDPNVHWEDQPKKGMFINFDNFSVQNTAKPSTPEIKKPATPTLRAGRIAIVHEDEESNEIKINEQLQV